MQQSELALFAQEFQRVLGPLAEGLGEARTRLAALASELPAARELAASLAALAAELEALATRVAEERSHLFVYGPPKAGKSTLIEALMGVATGAPSNLPSYPALTVLRPGARESALVTAFDGSARAPADPAALRLVLDHAHAELAARVRAAHAAGEVFDPPRHLAPAPRRVERTLPSPALAGAALELVECPPVHAPLLASYGETWLGEPERARAAVFVVRAAQLADDTVFDGIEELLERFQPLFLVLNVDARARELGPDGELVPAREASDPAALVSAFERLSTAEPLARAIERGSVPVFALDCLAAAAARRHGVEEPAGPSARFADLARALAAVLDGHEALQALCASALRRAGELGAEARELAATPLADELARRTAESQRAEATLARRLEALERLGARERARWETAPFFDELGARLGAATLARARALAQELGAPFARAIEDWFASGASLAELVGAGLGPRLDAARVELARSAGRVLAAQLAPDSDLAERAARLAEELAPGGLDFRALVAAAAEGLAGSAASEQPAALRVLDVEAVPVRARLGQRLTWRSPADVRRALLGPPEAPTAALPSREKHERLGDEGRRALRRSACERALAILEEEARSHARRLADGLVTRFLEGLARAVEEARARAVEPRRLLATRVAELAAQGAALAALAPASARATQRLEELAQRFGPRDLLVPAPRSESPSPPRAPTGPRPRGRREERV
ncbi:MAG TPA: hypothetical protein VF530_01800 [Planctomycetota bacterium]